MYIVIVLPKRVYTHIAVYFDESFFNTYFHVRN